MCFTSVVMDQWSPYIPAVPRKFWPSTYPPAPASPAPPPFPVTPQVAPPYTNEQLRELIDSLRVAVKAAETLDRITGQPDCVDPEKAALMDRVKALERRLDAIEEGA